MAIADFSALLLLASLLCHRKGEMSIVWQAGKDMGNFFLFGSVRQVEHLIQTLQGGQYAQQLSLKFLD
jgi:hypothetical protein